MALSIKHFALERKLTFGMVAVGLLLAAAVGASYFIKVSADRVEELGAASLARSVELDRALLSLLVAEYHQRTYLITGQEELLQPYEGARTRAGSAFTRLRYMYADAPTMLRDIDALAMLMETRLTRLDDAIEQRRVENAASVRASLRAELRSDPLDLIRSRLDDLKAREEQTHEELARSVDHRRTALLWVEVSLLLIMLLVGGGLYQGLLRQARERQQLAEQLEQQALHDPLTTLPNRRHLADELERSLARAARRRERRAILFVDLDGFKRVNDELGHHRGDEMLQRVAERFLRLARKGDFVARLGGDEFAVLLEDPSNDGACRLAKRLINAIEEPLLPDQPQHLISASIGVAIYPDDAVDPHMLLSQADTAMYEAKRAGKRAVRAYSAAA